MTNNSFSPSTTVVQFNARSPTNDRLTEFVNFLEENNPTIVILSETCWKPTFTPSFKSYNIVRRDRPVRDGGGVAILLHTSLTYSNLATPSSDTLESVGVTINKVGGGRVDFISVYIPHGDAREEEVADLFDTARNECFIGGDFNGHHRLWESRARSNVAGKAIMSTLIERPDIRLLTPKDTTTRIDPRTAKPSTIDLSFVSSSLATNFNVHVGPYLGSDHLPIFIDLDFNPQRAQCRAPKWIFKESKWATWNKKL